MTFRVEISWVATRVRSAATAKPLPPHHPPGDYVVDGPPLGQGWWGVTHKAMHIGDGKTYAVKTCKQSFRLHEEYLRHELENLAALPAHQNILRYHSSIITADQLHIVTEYIEAYKLSDLVPGIDGPYPRTHATATILRWIAQLFDGLAELHKAGMMHHDLHGDNILIEKDAITGTPSVGRCALRLIDFGVAKVYHDGKLQSQQDSIAAGCWQYFSPERRRGDVFDDRDDVWAAGCHLVQLASGRLIHKRKNCGDDGMDFATCPEQIAEAINDCGNCRCGQCAEAVLVIDPSRRPSAIAMRDLIHCQLLKFLPGCKRPRSLDCFTPTRPCARQGRVGLVESLFG